MNGLPMGITGLRLLLAPFLWAALWHFEPIRALPLFSLVALTDVLDGVAARRLNASTGAGAYFDATADFLVLFGSFAVLVLHRLYPAWLLLLLLGMFGQFVFTSRSQHPVYDPVGKHYGTALYACLGITILLPEYGVTDALLLYLLLLTGASLFSRSLI